MSKKNICCIVLALFLQTLNACEKNSFSKKIIQDQKTLLVTFILLNHTNIIADMAVGNGKYITSVLLQMNIENNPENINRFKLLRRESKSSYEFAKKIVDEY